MSSIPLHILKKHMSQSRISAYEALALSKGLPAQKAVDLYQLNIEICKELYALISCLEVMLRNNIHEKLKAITTDNCFSELEQKLRVVENKKNLSIQDPNRKLCEADKLASTINKFTTDDDIVSGLMLSFWCYLFDDHYEKIVWIPGLHKLFPKSTNRNKINSMLRRILTVRNRMSHFEPVIKDEKLLRRDFRKISTLLLWLSPDVHAWALSFNKFEELYKQLEICE